MAARAFFWSFFFGLVGSAGSWHISIDELQA